MKLYKRCSLILLTTPVLILGSCSDPKEAAQTRSQAKAPVPQVTTILARQDNPEYTLTLPGELMPFEQVEIYPKVKGFIKTLHADRGSQVKKGQLLAVLEAPEITQQYLSVQATSRTRYEAFRYSRQSFSRLKKAAAHSGAVAAIELDKALAQLRSDSAAYAAAQANTRAVGEMRAYLHLRAPFAGTITDRMVSVGALVGEHTPKGAALFTMAQLKKLRLTVAIPEKHAPSLQPGTQITFTVKGHPGKTFTSKLSRNGLVVNPQQRSVTAEFDISNQDKALNGGEFVQVKLTLRRPDATVWVPASTVVRAQSGVFVLQVAQGRVHRVPVTEGLRRDTLQEIFGEIAPGDLVVLKGREELEDNSPVKVMSPERQTQKKAVAEKR